MNIVFIIAAAIFIFGTLNGLRKGLIGAVFSTFILFAALAIAASTGQYAAKALKGTGIYDKIYQGVESTILSHSDDSSQEGSEEIPVSGQIEAINNLPLPESIRKGLIENNNTEIYNALGLNSFVAYVADYIAMMLLNAIGYILVFVVAYIILKLLGLLLNGVAHLPVLNGFNRLGGFLFGVCNGIMGIWLFFMIITAFGATGWGSYALEQINNNPILGFMYNHNYLVSVITNIGKIIL